MVTVRLGCFGGSTPDDYRSLRRPGPDMRSVQVINGQGPSLVKAGKQEWDRRSVEIDLGTRNPSDLLVFDIEGLVDIRDF